MSPRERLPNRRNGIRFSIGSGASRVHLATGEYEDGRLGEVFLDASKEGTFSRVMLNAFAMSMSLGLQHGVPLSAYLHTFREFNDDTLREIFAELNERYGDDA